MAANYLHQQLGITTLGVAFIVALAVYAAFVSAGSQVIGSLGLLAVLILAVLFGSLTVQVDRTHLRIRFGAGVIRRSWALKDIVSAEAVRNPWYTGWGIRMLPGRTVYNVSGFDAVEIALVNGKRYRVGTNDPQGLERALRSRIG